MSRMMRFGAAGALLWAGAVWAGALPYKSRIHMTSAMHGYALYASQGNRGLPDTVLETKDAGAKWTAIPAKSGKMAALLRDGTPAWFGQPQDVCPAGLDNADEDHRPLFSFADARHGWIATCADTSEDREIRSILRTEDAGVHWTRVAVTALKDAPGTIPLTWHKAGMFFLDAARGWLFGSDDSGAVDLFLTTDGGKVWKRQAVTVPANAWAGLRRQPDTMHFFGSRDAMVRIEIQLSTEQPAGTLYETHDAGQHWKIVGAAPGEHLSFSDIKHGFSAQGERLWTTHDGGRNWSQVSVGLGKIEEIQFISAQQGWVWTCGSSLDEKCTLLDTQDGGRHWFVMDPQIAEQATQ